MSIQEIVNQAEQIFNKQQTAFKIQFSFGFILRHIETGEFRYFIPARNLTLLERPFLIKNMTSIRRLKKKLEDISLQDFLHGQRDNTKWRLFYLTNLRISVFKTGLHFSQSKYKSSDHKHKGELLQRQLMRVKVSKHVFKWGERNGKKPPKPTLAHSCNTSGMQVSRLKTIRD